MISGAEVDSTDFQFKTGRTYVLLIMYSAVDREMVGLFQVKTQQASFAFG